MSPNAQNLIDFIYTVQTIKCDECGREESFDNCDEYDAAKILSKSGWKAMSSTCLCKKCFKKLNPIK